MKLKRLEMYGFKSFAKKIEVEFGEGITGIAGPNGAGKSNISDAIKFAVGDNVKSLRGNQNLDVIFSGNQYYHQAGLADVTIEFEDFSIKRRIYRTGESEFYINKQKCRLKDIIDLTMDRGINIISQNKVDEILKAKPEERRIYIEEAIGLMRYRNRKKETLLRLEDTEVSLTRVEDIINELKQQIEPLKKESERTMKYEILEEERQKIYFIEQREYRRQKEVEEDKLIEKESKLAKLESQKEEESKKMLDAEKEIQSKNEVSERYRRELLKVNDKVNELKSKKNVMILNQEHNEKQRVKMKRELEITEGNLKELQSKIQLQAENNKRMKKQLQMVNEELKRMTEEYKQRKSVTEEMMIKRAKKIQFKNELEMEIKIKENELKNNELQRKDNDKKSRQLEDELEMRQQALMKKIEENKIIKEEEMKVEEEVKNVEDKVKVVNKKQDEYRVQIEDNYKLLNERESRLKILKRMKENYEGYARAPKSILMSKESWRGKIYGAVGELIKVDKKYAIAIEMTLGNAVQNIVTEDEMTAKKAIEYLKAGRLGRVTFLPLNRITTYAPIKEINDEGVIGFANELVNVDEKLKKIADYLLMRTLIVDNIDNALKISRRHNVRIVTLEGEVLNIGGSISGGSTREIESGIFSRDNEILKLNEEVNKLLKLIEELKTEKGLLNNRLENLNDELKSKNKRQNELKIKLAENNIKLEENQRVIEERKKDLTIIKQEMKSQKELINEIEVGIRKADVKIKLVIEELKEMNKENEDSEERRNKLQVELKSQEGIRKRVEMELALNEQNQLRDENELKGTVKRIKTLEAELLNLREEEELLINELSKIEIEVGKQIEMNYKVKRELSKVNEEIRIKSEEKFEILAKISEQEKNFKEINKTMMLIKNKRTEIEMKLARLKLLMNGREYEVNEEYEEEKLQRRMKEIEGYIKELGAVNPKAVEEYERVNERYEFLNEQLEDLKQARGDMQRIISETDEQLALEFMKSFEQIQMNFNEIFIKIFGGGNAKIELTDRSNILNSGVEIMVSLPNKKRQSLTMLSGGEKALTVIALIFSFIRLKPSSFSVLDEVDATLDEANLLKFGNFLREFSTETQFILITHRKTLMEFLDNIYGVSIEKGISQVFSLKLNQAEASLN